MNSKERAYLKSISGTYESIFQVGKSSITPQVCEAISEALEKRELIKISVLKNCIDDPNEIAMIISERTQSQIVHVIGRKIVLYKKNKDPKKQKIKLPIA